ncbi:hypothetical protein BpHYR1_025752 [Brachionus plicatilis]|uniref:Uncharacterized protein n=1 Tax=Brachionus plicatilis TaxID=10195 RepID=A0A3M7RP68_BRAPC|nr:hypothetical protein BpHYR1_025752 [Brachionus plicatilis]
MVHLNGSRLFGFFQNKFNSKLNKIKQILMIEKDINIFSCFIFDPMNPCESKQTILNFVRKNIFFQKQLLDMSFQIN